MAIASKIRDEEMIVIDELSFSEPKTSEMAKILVDLGLAGTSTLVATEVADVNVYKSARNIGGVTVSAVAELNALSVLKPNRMLVTRAALDALRAGCEASETSAS